MTKTEFGLFASALQTYYPREALFPNSKAVDLWFMQLQDIDYKTAELVLNKWVATNKWSPSIADIRDQVAEITTPQAKDWGNAWQEVLSAIRTYGMYAEKEALESLEETTRQVVERLGFINLCLSENISVDRANFRMIYEEIESRKRRDNQVPDKLKALINQATVKLVEGGECEEQV